MANLLRSVKVREISLVKRGANPGARVLFHKRAEGTMSDTTVDAQRGATQGERIFLFNKSWEDGMPQTTNPTVDAFAPLFEQALRLLSQVPPDDRAAVLEHALEKAEPKKKKQKPILAADADEEDAEEPEADIGEATRDPDQRQGTSDVAGGGMRRRGRGRDKYQGAALTEGRFGKREPITKATVADAMDSYVERLRQPGETSAAAHARLGQGDPLYRQLYSLHTSAPAAAPAVETPDEEPSPAMAGAMRKAAELRTGKPVSLAKAVAQTFTDNPELYDRYLAEHPTQCGRRA